MSAIVLSAVLSPAQTYKFDFGTGPASAGWTKAVPTRLYDKGYAADTVTGFFGFEDWQNTEWGSIDRGGPDTLNRDFIAGYNARSFYFSVNVPEGKYVVTFRIGDLGDTAMTTIKAESRRLLVEKLRTAAGQVVTRTLTVMRRDPRIAASGNTVALDYSYGRENPAICLNWDRKLTFEFSGGRPCIGAMEIVRVDTGLTLHLCGNSTLVEQEDEPWTAWGQMVHRFFNASVTVNDLANSGQTSSGFLGSRRLEKICCVMKPGDYLFFEFGHNDSKGSVSTTQFQTNMRIFSDSAAAHGTTMVFVTPVARRTDTDSATSIGGYAELTRTAARTLNAKLIDLNAMSIRLKAALGNNSTMEYAHFAASPLWPDQPATNDDTHFSDFGAYELAKCVLLRGLKLAGLGLVQHLLDTTTFNPSAPDDPTAWSLPYSLDTVFRHPSGTIHTPVVAVSGTRNAPASGHPLSINTVNSTIDYTAYERGTVEFTVSSLCGRTILTKYRGMTDPQGPLSWRELGSLPRGSYVLHMKVNGRPCGRIKFCL